MFKKFFYSLFFSMIGLFAMANGGNTTEAFNAQIYVVEKTKDQKVKMNFKFTDFESFYNFNLQDVVDTQDEFCKTSVEITVSVGVGSTKNSVTIKKEDIPCTEIVTIAKDLKNQALKIVKD